MHEITNLGTEDGKRFITYYDPNTNIEMTYYADEIPHIKDDELREFLDSNI